MKYSYGLVEIFNQFGVGWAAVKIISCCYMFAWEESRVDNAVQNSSLYPPREKVNVGITRCIVAHNAPGSIRAKAGKGMPFERFVIMNLAF